MANNRSKALLKCTTVVVLLSTAVVAYLWIDGWWERRDFRRYVDSVESRGESLEIVPNMPRIVEEENNFAEIPLIQQCFAVSDPEQAELFALSLREFANLCPRRKEISPPGSNFLASRAIPLRAYLKTEESVSETEAAKIILNDLEAVRPILSEISLALKRDFAHFPVAWEDGVNCEFPHVDYLWSAGNTLGLRARASLQLGDADSAARDFVSGFRLVELMLHDPLEVGVGTANHILLSMSQSLWEACAFQSFTSQQLNAIQGQLGRINFLRALVPTMRMERARMMQSILSAPRELLKGYRDGAGFLRKVLPQGWIYRNARIFGKTMDILLVEDGRSVEEVRFDQLEKFRMEAGKIVDRNRPFEMYARTIVLWVEFGSTAFAAQAIVENAKAACALERFFAETGRYPEQLERLIPEYSNRLPVDIISGEALRYVLRTGDRPAIWSIGMNRDDDGGLPRKNLGMGDIVWQYDTPPGFEIQDLWE